MKKFKSLAITDNKVNKAEEITPWYLTNKFLYDICKKYPYHTETEIIIAKVLIIGRVYSVALERNKREYPSESNDKFYVKSVSRTFKNSGLDDLIKSMPRNISSDEIAIKIIQAHCKLMKCVNNLTEDNKRSFASKYLHFHLPKLFFIYDSRANHVIGKYAKLDKGDLELIRGSKNIDKAYAMFFLKCFRLQQKIKHFTTKKLNPRQIDNFLIR